LVKSKEEAVEVIKQLDGGADFQKLAGEKTNDPSGKTSGGDLGWFGPGQMVPEFEKAAFALNVGQYTKEPVQTQFGWHIIKLEDRRVKQPPAFEQVKDQVKSILLREKYFALVKQVRDAAKIDIPDPALKTAVDGLEKSQQ
jgi:peptidyl-prolyl cis-trans isomerase C